MKWAGGKRQLLHKIIPLIERTGGGSYCEPFLGSGAVLFAFQPKRAYINDVNADLIELYQVVRDSVDELVYELQKHKVNKEYYYGIRNWDRDALTFQQRTPIERAARFLYLNRTCFNGLYRVNRKGQFNVSYGTPSDNPFTSAFIERLYAVHDYLRYNDVVITNNDFAAVLKDIDDPGTFVYIDPPYYPLSQTALFTKYSRDGFTPDNHWRLKQCCDVLTSRGVRWLQSNSAAPEIRELYEEDYFIQEVFAVRRINSNRNNRGKIKEVLISNFDPEIVEHSRNTEGVM